MPNNRVQKVLAKRFVRLLSGSETGKPPWLGAVAEGDEAGLYLPNQAPWIVHADFATLVGGVRALLMQALHPGSLTGVRQHSRYEQDPLGRLAGTIRWLTVTTFGPSKANQAEANRVNKLHTRVQGEYQTASGEKKTYQAADKDLLLWVHVAFMDSFLRAHQNYSKRPIPGGADEYVRLWAESVKPLGLETAPLSEAELIETLQQFDKQLVVNDDTREVIKWLKNPPLPTLAKPFYRLFFFAALATMPKHYQELLNQKTLPLWFVKSQTTNILRIMRIAIGSESPIEDSAIARLRRVGVWQ
ncbi:MAG: oxygenase MpaB family protein [Micrococcales bacterium]